MEHEDDAPLGPHLALPAPAAKGSKKGKGKATKEAAKPARVRVAPLPAEKWGIGSVRCYLPELHRAEASVASVLVKLKAASGIRQGDVADWIKDYERKQGSAIPHVPTC